MRIQFDEKSLKSRERRRIKIDADFRARMNFKKLFYCSSSEREKKGTNTRDILRLVPFAAYFTFANCIARRYTRPLRSCDAALSVVITHTHTCVYIYIHIYTPGNFQVDDAPS